MNNYVISLTTAQDRRKHIEAEFGKQNIPFQFFDAITPNSMEVKALELGIDISNSALTKEEISCALSHISLWHLAKEQNLDYICIFEDDIYLGKNANLLLSNTYINDNVDIVKIERGLERLNLSLFPEKEYLERKFYILKTVNPGTGGYILTRKGINFLTSKVKEITSIEIDNLIFKYYLTDKSYTVWQMQPTICIQDYLLYPTGHTLGIMSLERDERRKKSKRKNNFLVRLLKEIRRPIAKLRLKLFETNSTFE
ncbi:TPA: glycosyltransferase family 25 protein [Mannheimia haemolytica]